MFAYFLSQKRTQATAKPETTGELCDAVGCRPVPSCSHACRIHGLRPPTAESRWRSPQLSEMPAGVLLPWSTGFLASRGESRNRSFRSAARCCQQPARWSFGTAARCTRSAVRAFVLRRFGAIRSACRSFLRPARRTDRAQAGLSDPPRRRTSGESSPCRGWPACDRGSSRQGRWLERL
jgi:hypothetical protein